MLITSGSSRVNLQNYREFVFAKKKKKKKNNTIHFTYHFCNDLSNSNLSVENFLQG